MVLWVWRCAGRLTRAESRKSNTLSVCVCGGCLWRSWSVSHEHVYRVKFYPMLLYRQISFITFIPVLWQNLFPLHACGKATRKPIINSSLTSTITQAFTISYSYIITTRSWNAKESLGKVVCVCVRAPASKIVSRGREWSGSRLLTFRYFKSWHLQYCLYCTTATCSLDNNAD